MNIARLHSVRWSSWPPSSMNHHHWSTIPRRSACCRCGRIAAGITRWSTARRTLIAVTEKRLRGGWASFLCRKRYIDDQLVDAVAKGLAAVVILGAGYDVRAHRLPEPVGIPICEVDLPNNIARNAAALRRCFGQVPPGVHPAAVRRSRLSARIFWAGRRCTAPSPPTRTSW